jgi:signal transduction histidine kinase
MAPVFFLNALLAFTLSAVVFHAAPRRLENRWLALVGCIDASTATALGLVYVAGHQLTDPLGLRAWGSGGILISYPFLYFTLVFPFGHRPRRQLHLLGLLATALALLLELHPVTSRVFVQSCTWVYFFPLYVLTARAVGRTMRRLAGQPGDTSGIRMILWAALARWTLDMVAWGVLLPLAPGIFPSVALFSATTAVLAGYVVISYAILRHQLFRVRGVLAEMALWAVGATLVVGMLACGVVLVQNNVSSPSLARVALVAVGVLPPVLLVVLRRLGPRIESSILGPLDPRRAQRHGTLERAVSASAALVDPAPLLALTNAALGDIAGGGEVRFLAGPALLELGGALVDLPTPSSLPGPLRVVMDEQAVPYLHQPLPHALPDAARDAFAADGADLMVPVRLAGRLYGALAVTGGTLDRDTLLTAVALADNLAGKLERCLLFQGRLRLQSELEAARRLASLGSFAAAIAHDIRTPLTSIQMNVQMLRRKVRLPADDMECFEIALDELSRLDDHVSEILDFAKPLRLHKGPVDLRELTDEAAQRLTPILAERQLVLEQRHPAFLSLVHADPQRLRQVLVNLVDNAACASPAGGAIVIATRDGPGGTVMVEVSDSGRGISAENLQKIFEPFFTTRADGTGLGLAIVHKVVKAHGGEIAVRSLPGQGATFTVLLPVQSVPS